MSMIDSTVSDYELKSRLKEAGIDHGPINDSTRHLYINLFKKRGTTKPIKKSAQKKSPSPHNSRADGQSPPKSPPVFSAKRPSLKRSSSDTINNDSPTKSSHTYSKKLKRHATGGLSGLDVISPSNGTVHESTTSLRRNSERSKRARSSLESQDSDISTSSTIGSDGSQPIEIDVAPLIPKNPLLLPSIPEETDADKNIHLPKFGIEANDGPFRIPPAPLFAIPRMNGVHNSPAVRSIPKPLKHKAFNDQSHPAPAPSSSLSNNFAVPASSSKMNGESKNDWELNSDCLSICKTQDGKKWRLGIGGYCEVYRGLMHEVDDVAVKICKISSKESLKPFAQEIELISKLHHRNILQFYGACLIPNNIYMVTELMDVDLFTGLKSDPKMQWSGEHGLSIARDIALGMNYLHKRDPTVVHRDLKSSNVMLHRYIAKIGDVGIARLMTQDNMTAQSSYTLAWAAPEVVYRHRATEKIDIWSFGVILWEILTGKVPNTGYLSMPYWCPENIKSIYVSCIFDDPNLRPTAADIVKSLDQIQK